ncbi:MAG: hypothetical protein ACI4Q3_00800 [Kiritimatiellia bacterium]
MKSQSGLVMIMLGLAAGLPLAARELPQGDDAKRPYEMVWANRTRDAHEPLLALTDASGWTVETTNAEATFARTTDRLLFGDGVCRLTYRATGTSPSIFVKPPKPVPVRGPVDTVSCWVYGNNVYYVRTDTPSTTVFAEFLDGAGKPFSVRLIYVNHLEWHLAQRRLPQELIDRVKTGATFLGFRVTGGTNTTDRSLDFNSFCVFREEFRPLAFRPRAQRPNRVFPEVSPGVNTGHGLLPFPNAPLGVVPPGAFRGELAFRLPTRASNWDDGAVRWGAGAWQTFSNGGGVWFAGPASAAGAVRRAETQTTVTTNRVSPLDVTLRGRVGDAVVTTRFHQEGCSLVADVATDAKEVAEVRFGAWVAPRKPRLVTLPYYSYGNWGAARRPAVLVTEGGAERPLFHLATVDWTQSNASEPFAEHLRFDGALASNGGVRYWARTDGGRNVCRERFVYSFSDRFDQVLPNIPNPVSPWKHVTGSGVWRSHGAGEREKDKAYWRAVRARGLKHVIVTDHEVGWRDGNESFTFRTEPAPKKGGVKGQYDYARTMIDELGFVYGPYNNFTDFAPVNANWHADRVSRTPDLQLQTAWNRCYAPKPAYAVEACAAFTPVNQSNFGVNTAYCDVHTAVTPWSRTDYDARVPGAGTFAATFYAFGEILLIQKGCWQGPVYSEGGCHYLYCGLADGNYAQDQSYGISVNPWLVDFDLLRLHPKCCNFGMGDVEMFYPGKSAPADADEKIDRFLAATVAFGHPGYLVRGQKMEDRSYFMVQALAARYTQAEAAEIRYIDADGTAHDTSSAVARGVFRRSQVTVRYADGTYVAANGSKDQPMQVQDGLWLPPNGYCGWTGDGSVFVYSGLADGHRIDYAVGPEYVYMDGRGVETKLPGGTCTGAVIRLRETVAGVWPSPTPGDFAARSVPPAGMFKPPAPPSGFPLPDLHGEGMQIRGRDIQPVDRQTGAHAAAGTLCCGGVAKRGLTMHPPYKGGPGCVFVRYALDVPDLPVRFSAMVGKGDGSDPGDGIVYRVELEEDGRVRTLAEVSVTRHEWTPIAADLSAWRGRPVTLRLVADCGPANNTAGDWAGWGDLKLERIGAVTERTEDGK